MKIFVFWRALALVCLVLGLEHSCPWHRGCLSSERLSLALASSLVSSTPPLLNSYLGFQPSMVFILNANKDFKAAQLDPCFLGLIKMTHDWAKSGNSVGTPNSKKFQFFSFYFVAAITKYLFLGF